MTKRAIFITVRTASTRLPKKALLKIDGKTTIEFLIDRAKKSNLADQVVLCTTTLDEDLELVQIAKNNGIDFFRGSVEDKLMRWKGACDRFNIDYFITSDGDDFYSSPELMDLAFKQFENTGSDFIEGKDIIFGCFSFAIKADALRKVCDIKDTDDTEMMWVYFTETGFFKTELLKNVPEKFKRPDIRMTLDYEDDFKFFKNIAEHFSPNKDFSLDEIVDYLNENPGVIQINQHLHEDWLQNQKNKTKLVIKSDM